MKINAICPIIGTSGYSVHSRNLINALSKYHDIKLFSGIPQGMELQVTDNELSMMKKTDDSDRLNLIIDLPQNWLPHLRKKNNIGFLVFEGDKIPLSWVDIVKDPRVSQVWVPSNHVFQAIKGTIQGESYEIQQILNKVKIVHHGVDLSVFKPLETHRQVFTFICNKGFRGELDRGGIQHVIRAFLEEFNKGEARLILKINLAYAIPPEFIQQIIFRYSQEIGKKEIPEIGIVYDNLRTEDLNVLYNNCDVYVNASEAEAFNLPCIEAMACGKPVISTNFGGQTDYVTNKNGWLVDYELHNVKHEILYEGINWGRPKIENLRRAMRMSMNKEVLETKSKEALETASQYTWDNSAQKASQYLKELE